MANEFIDVSWDTGDWITKEKMNAMTGNDKYLYEEGPDYTLIMNGDVFTYDASGSYLDGVTINLVGHGDIGTYTQVTNLVDSVFCEADIDITGVSEGLNYIIFEIASSPTNVVYKWYKTENQKFLTIWLTCWNRYYSYGAHSVTIIAHESAESWTT